MLHLDFHASYTIPGWPGFAMQVFLVGIILGYHIIAWQFWRNVKAATGRAAIAFFQLVAIFLFCSYAGYGPRLVQVPDWLFVVFHGLLFFATWWYVLSRQAAVIAEAMSRNDGL